jgi:hypothetical protein
MPDDDTDTDYDMESKNPEKSQEKIASKIPLKKPNDWKNDSKILELSELFLNQFNDTDQMANSSSNNPSSSLYPPANDKEDPIRQKIRFSLLQHRGTIGILTTLQLFRSFASTL